MRETNSDPALIGRSILMFATINIIPVNFEAPQGEKNETKEARFKLFLILGLSTQLQIPIARNINS